MKVSASSQAHWCSLEVPLDAARCRHSVHWREGGPARRSRVSEWCTAYGVKKWKRWAAEMVSLATERLSPPPIFSLPLIRRRTSFRRRRQEAGEIPNDDHAVLLVDEAVHFRPYLLDGGLHLLAVDVDGYPAGAALCHKPVVCGIDCTNIRHG